MQSKELWDWEYPGGAKGGRQIEPLWTQEQTTDPKSADFQSAGQLDENEEVFQPSESELGWPLEGRHRVVSKSSGHRVLPSRWRRLKTTKVLFSAHLLHVLTQNPK